MKLPFIKPVYAHCDLPCGVYDPAQARIEALSVYAIQTKMKDFTGDDRVASVQLGWSVDVEVFRQRIINAVDEAFPSNDPVWTTEVDVIGFSMGGLAPRYAAMAPTSTSKSQRRLKIHRLRKSLEACVRAHGMPDATAVVASPVASALNGLEMSTRILPASD